MRHIDVAIIGGSLAGSACASELARRHIDVVAFERGAMPRDKVCGGFLSPGAVACLDQIGFLDAVYQAGAKRVQTARVSAPTGEARFSLPQPGLGISRKTLDAIVAAHAPVERGAVRDIMPLSEGFRLDVDGAPIHARVVVDAAGKLSRFTPRRSEPEFGAQFYDDAFAEEGVVSFWFFEEGYGGAVDVEDNRVNCCFLIRKSALERYRSKPGCLVAGPLAYATTASPWIAIGDAAGMIDPFCGEGMRHALDTAITAARAVADGFHRGWGYSEIRQSYLADRNRRWATKRRLSQLLRQAARRPALFGRAFALAPGWFIERVWA
jgi:flavin-dependent dehydrogenase